MFEHRLCDLFTHKIQSFSKSLTTSIGSGFRYSRLDCWHKS